MSWASRRRTEYLGGIFLFFALLIGIPIVHYFLSIKPTCFDGIQNQGETAVDEGGPCLKLDPNALAPYATLWARSFEVRSGSYTAVAYIVNPNLNAGVAEAHYRFGLYDSNNALIAEATSTTFIMPGGGITPVIMSGLQTGNRIAVHTEFEITDNTLTWDRMTNPASAITFTNQQSSNIGTTPRITATAENSSFNTFSDVVFVAVVFDESGNAIAASQTALSTLAPNTPQEITFTWPQAFPSAIGRIDIIPLLPPQIQNVPTGN